MVSFLLYLGLCRLTLLCFILISFLLLPLDSLIYLIFLFVFLSHLYVFVLFLVSFLSFPYFSFPFLFFYFLILIFYFSLFKYFLASPSIPKKNRKKELHADYVSKFHHYTESFLLNMLMIRQLGINTLLVLIGISFDPCFKIQLLVFYN